MCLGKEVIYSHLRETNVLTSRNSKAFMWIRNIAPIIGISSEPRLCQRSALQLPGLWMHIVPTNYKRQRAVGGLTVSSKTACFTAVDDAQQRSACQRWTAHVKDLLLKNKVAEIKHCVQIVQGTDRLRQQNVLHHLTKMTHHSTFVLISLFLMWNSGYLKKKKKKKVLLERKNIFCHYFYIYF